ncbi:IS1 transposase subfamily, putative [Synechococcus sp. PCC 7335]|nr:IS1 transposase subfamily, putative [Synechococcus sp. PCC 7335]
MPRLWPSSWCAFPSAAKRRGVAPQFVEDPQQKRISDATKALIDDLLLERLSMAGIARVAKVSEPWLQQYASEEYADVPRQAKTSPKKGPLTLECDEAWSFVGSKSNKQWIWLAINRDTRETIGMHIGGRNREGARSLWACLPPVYRQCAVCYTDFWERCDPASLCGARERAPRQAYEIVLPSKRHRAVSKNSGQTNHIERFNCTLRQRVSRLVRKSLSFSKKLENHIGAIWYFIHHYNTSLLL